jgi:hypothetical protein
MARIPQPDRALFPEPDHVPELETQDAYEELRTNPWLGVDDEPVTAQRLEREVPAQLSAKLAEQGAQEREQLRLWRKGGEKGARPLTPAIEALGARRGCTRARTD